MSYCTHKTQEERDNCEYCKPQIEMAKLEEKKDNFEKELKVLINKYGLENQSSTPDFILAEFLRDCLGIFEYAVRDRDDWHGTEMVAQNIAEKICQKKK